GAAAAFLGETLTVLLAAIGARLFMLTLVHLLDEARVGLAAMLPLGVRLRSLLRWRRRPLRVENLFVALGGRLLLVVVLSIGHDPILPSRLVAARVCGASEPGQWTCPEAWLPGGRSDAMFGRLGDIGQSLRPG